MVTLFVKRNQKNLIFSRFSDFFPIFPDFLFSGFSGFFRTSKIGEIGWIVKNPAIYESSIPLEHFDRNKTKNNSQ